MSLLLLLLCIKIIIIKMKRYTPIPFEKYRDKIINNQIKTIKPKYYNITKNNCKEFIELLNNNTSVELLQFPYNVLNTESVEKFAKLLKTNTTIKHLILPDNVDMSYECCKLITEAIGENSSIEEFYWLEPAFSSNELKLVSDMIKVNKSLKKLTVYFHRTNINNDAIIYMIDSLKLNKTLTYVVIPMNLGNFHVTEYFANFLKENSSITNYSLTNNWNIDQNSMKLIIDALYYNPYVIKIDGFIYGLTDYKEYNNIIYYLDRNQHNLKLKSMLLQDICL